MALRPAASIGGFRTREQIEQNFADLHPPLGCEQAEVAAERSLNCYDAPCIVACPTSIDIPTFIRQIWSQNLKGSAETFLSANFLGGSCGRACPTVVLCE